MLCPLLYLLNVSLGTHLARGLLGQMVDERKTNLEDVNLKDFESFVNLKDFSRFQNFNFNE